jgi:hypothetical protein
MAENFRALKILVISLGVVIIAGTAVVVGTIIHRIGERGEPGDRNAPRGGAAGPAFGDVRIDVPRGSRIEQSHVVDDRIILRLSTREGATRLLVIDLKTGREIGRIGVHESQ